MLVKLTSKMMFAAAGLGLDVLMCNAGHRAGPRLTLSPDAIEMHYQVNLLASIHQLLLRDENCYANVPYK